jgi:hypothetical protein
MSRPACGPNAWAIATPRFSSTMGGGADLSRAVVERGDADPVGVLGSAGSRMAGGDRGLQGVRPGGPAKLVNAVEGCESAADEEVVPAGAVLVHEEHGLAARSGAGLQPGGLELNQRPDPATQCRAASGWRACDLTEAPPRTGRCASTSPRS